MIFLLIMSIKKSRSKNKEIARLFYEIVSFLKMEAEHSFRASAYERAGIVLEALDEEVSLIYKRGGEKALKEISAIGEGLAKKIIEYLETGKINYHQQLKEKTPIDLETLSRVEGLGPKRIKFLHRKLGIIDLKSLEKAAKDNKIAPLLGFGPKSQKNILEAIAFVKKSRGRFLLGEILESAEEIKRELEKLKEVKKISIAGSIRRKKETIGDVDFLVVTKNPQKVMDFFVSLPGVVKIWAKGATKASVRMDDDFDADLRIVPAKSYGSALQYFTGSKEHNIETRKIAIDKGLKLSEYGLFKGRKMIAGADEKNVYHFLGMDWPAPEIRENRGEIDACLTDSLPCLIELKDIKGDLHCHSVWDGGVNTILEMAKMAKSLGYEYLGISDHTKFLKIEDGLNEQQLAEQRKEIDKLNHEFKASGSKFHLLQGAELNILNDGSLDIKDSALAKLDYAIAGIHSNMKMPKDQMTTRIIRAMKNPFVKIISHPTGRLLGRRDEYEIDFNKVLQAAKEFKVVLEINASPFRLDLDDKKIKMAKEQGVKMIINSDAHHQNQLESMRFGVYQARRGWAEKKDIINTKSLKNLLTFLNKL